MRWTAMTLVAMAALAGACASQAGQADAWAARRSRMVAEQIEARGIRDARVLAAMRKVPRHEFVPPDLARRAYDDTPLPIGHEQTISQPYIVAFMTTAAAPQPGHRVLEVGTGSGYQAAVLAELAGKVHSIELIPALATTAAARLRRLGYGTVQVRAGDGYLGWPDAAPFDVILVTAGAPHVPEPLFQQLKPGGRMVIPVDDPRGGQMLRLIEKGPNGERKERDELPVRFVPLLRQPH